MKSSEGDLLSGAFTWKKKAITLNLFKRNLQSLEYTILIRVRRACLFIRQPRGKDAMFLPETFYFLILEKGVYYKRKWTTWIRLDTDIPVPLAFLEVS